MYSLKLALFTVLNAAVVNGDPVQIPDSRFYHDSTIRTWEQCKAQIPSGFTFASIQSAEENQIILDFGTRMHAGGKRVTAGSSDWVWEDGTDWNYEGWHTNPMQPDNPTTELFLEVNWYKNSVDEKGWNDAGASHTQGCLFATPYNPPTPAPTAAMERYAISSDHTVNKPAGKVFITRTFGQLTEDAETELLDKDCKNPVDKVLTKSDTPFNQGVFLVQSTISVDVNDIDNALSDNIVFDSDGDPFPTIGANTTEGIISFCLKSTSKATWGGEEIEMSVYKGGYNITYTVEDTFFVVTSVTESAIDSEDDVGLNINLQIVAKRCSEGSSADFSGNANTIVEGEIYYLCLKVDGGSLSNITLNALYGVKDENSDTYADSISLISNDDPSLPIIQMSTVENWEQISVPIVAAFLQGSSELKLSGNADIAFAGAKAERLVETEEFDIVVKLAGAIEEGCFSKLFRNTKDFFF